jgi:hypothetical protein
VPLFVVGAIDILFLAVVFEFICKVPSMSRVYEGVAVFIPTFPLFNTDIANPVSLFPIAKF